MDKRDLIDILESAPCALDCTESRPCRKCAAVHLLEREVAGGCVDFIAEDNAIPWKEWNGSPVHPSTRDAWAEELVDEGEEINFVFSGDSLVLSVLDEDSDTTEVFDCLVRRKAFVR